MSIPTPTNWIPENQDAGTVTNANSGVNRVLQDGTLRVEQDGTQRVLNDNFITGKIPTEWVEL